MIPAAVRISGDLPQGKKLRYRKRKNLPGK
jgi:hypothetical protein